MTVKKFLAASAALLVLVAGGAFAVSSDSIAERIKPFGVVCVAGDPCADVGTMPTAVADAGAARTGEAVYGQFCTACHSAGILNAPKTGDAAAWEARLAAAGSFDDLVTSAINGVGAMPANGTCGDCSREEIHAAVEHMSGLQ
ncbi:c-type cytochrome [Halopseudomonas salina]|uniref:Cytochrome c n=1 Tax=Halopseudomonas salina TaxID=1323744 RepID=A0ABQ1PAR5_9GAMM|nr:c-type cytochrome [Halopseudomonas salina]GGC93084.1 cytochrome c [Halopseudomonas salina]